METPKNVKQAMDNDSYIVDGIDYKGSKKILVKFKPRFNRGENCSFWIDRDYFQRTYTNTYDRN